MRDFHRGNRFGGGGGGRGDSRGGRRDGPRPEMHKAICSQCDSPCEVPFMPTGSKPVYCSACFKKTDNAAPRRSDRPSGRDFGRSNFDRPNFERKQMFSAVCDECGSNCEIPFRPTSGKPVYCGQCFVKSNSQGGGSDSRDSRDSRSSSPAPKAPSVDQYKKQFEMLNEKLDKLLTLLAPAAHAKPTEKKAEVKKEVAAKEVIAKEAVSAEKKKDVKVKKSKKKASKV